MHNYTILCKLANITNEEEGFKHKDKYWNFDYFTENQIIDILDCCQTNKRSGFIVIENINALYVAFKQSIRSDTNPEQFYVQQKLFPIIFKDYKPDLRDLVYKKIYEEEKTLKLVKNFVTLKLYEALFVAHKTNRNHDLKKKLEMPSVFLPTLCRYQEHTVHWLLKREKEIGCLPTLFQKLESKNGEKIFKNILCNEYRMEEPPLFELAPGGILADEMGLGKTVEMLALILLNKRDIIPFRMPEMLEEQTPPPEKKTKYDTVFCICTSKKKRLIECSMCGTKQHERCMTKNNEAGNNDPHICPSCWNIFTQDCLIESGGTLIVTPNTIKRQWVNEIKRHLLPPIRLHVYDGVSNGNWINPQQLSSYDIVVTDYMILRREVFHTTAQDTDRVMRHKPRTMRLYTPLMMINWWRVCLDEAQMVESDTSQMAALVRRIPGINRWAVTGTPIQRSLDDLYPLVRFIGLENDLSASAWDNLVKDFMLNGNSSECSSLKLIEVLQNFMWRTCKNHVLDELPIPPQTEIVHRLTLGDLERLFYTEQHEECELKFNETLNKYIERTDTVMSTSHTMMKIIMTPLLKIRQCCTIPTVDSFHNKHAAANSVMEKKFLQPKELHAHLKLANEKDCKSELRSMASSYNGCAAIHFINKNYEEAVKNYECVLKLAKDYGQEGNISVDSLLQIHALYNILEARNSSPKFAEKFPQSTLADYESQLNDLEWKYLQTSASEMARAKLAYQQSKQTLEDIASQLNEELLDFLSILLNINDVNMQTQLMAKILEECIRKFGSMRLEAASSLRGVLFMIVTWHGKLMKAYEKIEKALEELEFYTANVKPRSQVNGVETWRQMSKFITTVYDCHLMELRNLNKNEDDDTDEDLDTSKSLSRKRKPQNKNLCKLCKLQDHLNGFECLLFKKTMDQATNNLEGNENPQLEIEIIKIIFTFLKTKRPDMAHDMEQHFLSLQNMQSFCKKALKYWIEIEFTVKAYDELDMCKMRITLTDDDDEEKSNFKLKSFELDDAYVEQQTNLFEAQRNFAIKLARLKYIKHLESNAYVGPCPICQTEDEERHIVLECGHQLCFSCFKNVRQYSPGAKLNCPICRNTQSTEKIYFVTCASNKQSQEENFSINGDFSSKITYIVQLVLKLLKEHRVDQQNATCDEKYPLKILIFSQWQSILDAIARAFNQNDVRCVLYSTVRTLENFKDPDLGLTCLLMPLAKGCKGLNLIEATHVFLVEPILNPSEEQQAIGRVHRFGQTRPTTVHRFIVDGTIEENIFKVVSAGKEQQKWEFDNMTFDSLQELFRLQNNLTAELEDNNLE